MTTQLNTLFVTAEAARVHKDHESIVVRVDDQVRARVPMLHLAGMVVMAPAWVSPDVMHALVEQGAGVSFLSPAGKFLARVEGVPGGSVLVRRAQFRAAESAASSLSISRSMVGGKIYNARVLLQRAAREAEGERASVLGHAVEELRRRLREVELADNIDSLRGVEGAAARQYWGVFDRLIKNQHDGFRFSGRSRRPPGDRINALLSFGYSLLMHDCATGCGVPGLDPAVGFLHEDRPGRLSLALDLMEELRVPIVDRMVLALINREQLRQSDFVEDPLGGWSLTKDGRKTFFVAWQDGKKDTVNHPFLEEDTTYQRLPVLQAMLLARHLRGDIDNYPPFLLK